MTKEYMEPDGQHLKWGIRGMAMGTGYQKHVDRVMVYELKRFFSEIGLAHQLNQGKGVIELPNDCQILLGSAENPNSLEGPHLNGPIWMDEAGLMQRLAWEVAQRRTAYHNTRILITTVPYFTNWLKSEIYEAAMAGESWVKWIHCTTLDNLDYSREAAARLAAKWRPDKVQRYLEGIFARPYGLIYGEPSDDTLLIVDPEVEFARWGGEIPEEWPSFAGHDWGMTNPTAGVWGRLSGEDVLYIVAEYEVPELTVEDHVTVWKSLGLDWVDAAWGDPSAPEQWETAARKGYPILDGENNVGYGIDLVYDRFKTGRLKVLRGLKNFLDHRNTYVWAPNPKEEDELLDKPKKPQPAEHMMDALRYLVAGLIEYGAAPAPAELSVGSQRLGKV